MNIHIALRTPLNILINLRINILINLRSPSSAFTCLRLRALLLLHHRGLGMLIVLVHLHLLLGAAVSHRGRHSDAGARLQASVLMFQPSNDETPRHLLRKFPNRTTTFDHVRLWLTTFWLQWPQTNFMTIFATFDNLNDNHRSHTTTYVHFSVMILQVDQPRMFHFLPADRTFVLWAKREKEDQFGGQSQDSGGVQKVIPGTMVESNRRPHLHLKPVVDAFPAEQMAAHRRRRVSSGVQAQATFRVEIGCTAFSASLRRSIRWAGPGDALVSRFSALV